MRLLGVCGWITSLSLIVGGCGPAAIYGTVDAIGVPIETAIVLREPSGKLSYYKGTIRGRQLVADSTIELQKIDSDVTCSGSMTQKGAGSMICTDGRKIALNTPSELVGKMNGSFVGRDAGGIFAAGWGNDADLNKLAKMLPPR